MRTSTHRHRRTVAGGAVALVVSLLAASCSSGSTGLTEADQRGASALTPLVTTSFDAARHGLQFTNDFEDQLTVWLPITPIAPVPVKFNTSGLCGGMVYTALDYFNAGRPIPLQSYRPAEGTALKTYIYNRQAASLTGNLEWWANIGFNPLGSRNSELFNQGLQGTFAQLRGFLDAGKAVPLGLQGANGNGQHQVLAIGYDYIAPTSNAQGASFEIHLYNPNYPGGVVNLLPDMTKQVFTIREHTGDQYQTYFVDTSYKPDSPPTIPEPVYPVDGLVHELFIDALTGDNDLYGGSNKDVSLTLNLTDGTAVVLPNIDGGQHWLPNYSQTVRYPLPAPLDPRRIASLSLSETFACVNGLSLTPWDLASLRVEAVGSSTWILATAPAKHFDCVNRTLAIKPLQLPPTVTSATPLTGVGGSTIRISGAGFDTTGRTTITFGATAATGVACASSTQCTATVPPGTGTVPITVHVPVLGAWGSLDGPPAALQEFTARAGSFVYTPLPTSPNCTYVADTNGTISVHCTPDPANDPIYVFQQNPASGAWTQVADYQTAFVGGWGLVGVQGTTEVFLGCTWDAIYSPSQPAWATTVRPGAMGCDPVATRVAVPACVPRTTSVCALPGSKWTTSQCGPIPDGCGGTIQCPPCPVCVPTTCAAEGVQCGSWTDGCGHALDCGGCGAGQTCNDGTCAATQKCTTQAQCCEQGGGMWNGHTCI